MIENPQVICFAGDWHGNTDWATKMIEFAKANGAEAIVHVGDFGFGFDYTSSFVGLVRKALVANDIDLVFVDGNHDNWAKLNRTWIKDDQGFMHPRWGETGVDRFHYAPRGHRWTWNNKVFMGLGGAVPVDKNWRIHGTSWWPEETITMQQAEFAARPGKVDVMVCHDLCGKASLPNLRKSSGWPEDVLQQSKQHREIIQAVVDEVKPELFVHGHFHIRFSQNILVGDKWMRVETLDMDATSETANLWLVNANLDPVAFTFKDYDHISYSNYLKSLDS